MSSTQEKPEELDRIQKRVNKILEARLESDKVSAQFTQAWPIANNRVTVPGHIGCSEWSVHFLHGEYAAESQESA